jgi:hypothetical protein
MKHHSFEHEFVELMPSQLSEGVLYVSMVYATTVHLCACGCGNKVVLPLNPAEWQLAFDGDTISLSPSVGNWEFPCRSHYWIRNDRVRWAGAWSEHQIESGRRRDAAALASYQAARNSSSTVEAAALPAFSALPSLWSRFRSRLK